MTAKKILIFFAIILSLLLLCGGAVAYCVFSERGSQFVAHHFLQYAFKNADISFDEMTGSFGSGFRLKNLVLTNTEQFPAGSIVRVQELSIVSPIWKMNKAEVVIVNGRVFLPQSDTIVLDGKYHDGQADFSLYTFNVNLDQLKKIFNLSGIPPAVFGDLDKVDLKISGTLVEPAVTGNLNIQKLNYKEMTLNKSPVSLDLKFKRKPGGYSCSGTVILTSGEITAKRVKVELKKSTLYIAGDIANPSFYIEGQSKVENTDIHILLTGTKDKPDLNLTSDSGESKEKLLLMLATGKSWKSLDTAIATQQVSPDLVKDIIKYFVFPDSGDKLANKLGIKSVSLTMEENKRGIGVKKQVTRNLDVGYEVEETQVSPEEKTRQHILSGDVNVSDNLSVSVEKELKGPEQPSAPVPDDNKVFLKYKSSF